MDAPDGNAIAGTATRACAASVSCVDLRGLETLEPA